MTKLFLLAIFMCIVPIELLAQVKCANKVLAEIVEKLPDIRLDEGFTGEVMIPTVSDSKPVIVERNNDGVINHIGIKFFDRDIIQKHPSRIYSFIERYFLELLLLPTQDEIAMKLKMEHVNISSEIVSIDAIKKGIQDIVGVIPNSFSVYITCNNNQYTASCINDNKLYAKIKFPVRYELITGLSKLEAENSVYGDLLMHTKKDYKPLTDADMSEYKDNMFCANEDYYVTEDIISNSYYNKVNGSYVPIHSSEYLEESVYSLFNTGFDWGIVVDVEQNMYGDKKKSFSLPLSHLTQFIMDNGCTLYTGIRKFDKTIIEGFVMGVNMELGYQHIMMFSFNKDLLNDSKNHKVKIKMYSYVPIHNVSSILN